MAIRKMYVNASIARTIASKRTQTLNFMLLRNFIS